ncbi:unnamed protein product [Rotaria sp. Silwood2]|nr:unnamed protein product [Rotaria sp. Silwood2]
MPRIYKRKTEDKYTPEDLDKAVLEVREKKLSVKDAAAHYHIPIRTIFHKLSGNRSGVGRGTKTRLTKEEESYLVHTILLFQKWQRPLSPSIIIGLAKSYMIQLNKNISKNFTLRDWFYGFMQRWSNEIKLAKTVKLEKSRSVACRKEIIDAWFKHLREVLEKFQLLDRPEALWNADESGFFEDPGRRSVVVKRGTKHAISSQSGTGKSMTTVLMCVSANGEKLPPYIVYRGIKLWSSWITKNGFPGTRYNVTQSGWVEEETFYDWFVNQFCPAVEHIKRPVMLFFDGHHAHISARIVKHAMVNKIELECLPPHTTTLLQPLDVVTLNKVKTAWRNILVDHNMKTNSAPIGKQEFSLMISDLWKNHILKGHCSNGFTRSSIYPYDPRAVSKEKLLGSSLWNNENDLIDESPAADDSCIEENSFSSNDLLSRNVALTTTYTQTDLDQNITVVSPPQMNMTNQCLIVDGTITSSNDVTLADCTDSESSPRIFTDLTDQRITSINTSFSTSQTPADVLAKVINQYMTSATQMPSSNQRRQMIDRNKGQSLTSVEVLKQLEEKEKNKKRKLRVPTKNTSTDCVPKKRGRPTKITQQQMLHNIDQLSAIGQWDNPDLQSESTHFNQNLSLNQYENSYSHMPSDQSHYASTYLTQQPAQMKPTCYRCNILLYGNFTNCITCGRPCCQVCVQTHFFSHPITCEYCIMQKALTVTKNF